MLVQNKSGWQLLEYLDIEENEIEQYDKVTGAFAIVNVKGQYLVGFNHWRKQWEFPAGRIEAGETARQAAERELFEETHQGNSDMRFKGLFKVKKPSGEIAYQALFVCQQDELVPFIRKEDDEMDEIMLWDLKRDIGYVDEVDLKMVQMTCLQICTANSKDYENVRDFYYMVTDSLKDSEFGPGWMRDIYPTQEFLKVSIEKAELYIGEIDGQIVSCMVVNHEYNENYKEIDWLVKAEDAELLVIHALGVAPAFSGRGIAKQMVQNVIAMAQENKIKTIRLDVLEGNIPAERAYTKLGFKYLDTIPMFYEDTGWTNYKAFEFIV